MNKENNQRDPFLSKWYAKILRYRFQKTVNVDNRRLIRWAREHNIDAPGFRDVGITSVAMFYNKTLLMEAVKHNVVIDVPYLGKVMITETKYASARPRTIKNEDGEFEEVIQDEFTKTPRFFYRFEIMRTKIKKHLRSVVVSGVTANIISLYLPIIYETHPKGKYYPLKK